MKISTSKTKTMVNSTAPQNHRISCEGQPLEQVQQFKYLGCVISANRQISAEINQRIASAGKLYHALNKEFICKTGNPKETKVTVFNNTLCPNPYLWE